MTTITASRTPDGFEIFRQRNADAPVRIGAITVIRPRRYSRNGGWASRTMDPDAKPSRVLVKTPEAAAHRRWGAPARDAVIKAARNIKSQDVLAAIEVRP